MGRSQVTTIKQLNSVSCGPAAVKHALEILGKRKSLTTLSGLCKTSRNGTSTKNLIHAFNVLGFSVLMVQKATLHHVISALKYAPLKPRALIVDYLYNLEDTPEESSRESGHWATVSSYRSREGKIILFDSYTGKKKSYNWCNFRERWIDFDVVKKKSAGRKGKFRMYKKLQRQLLFIVSRKIEFLPKFRYASARIFPSVN
jgi:ABC-type bacteriocin/lantibiotic exporter with double-glycine peptidase domain